MDLDAIRVASELGFAVEIDVALIHGAAQEMASAAERHDHLLVQLHIGGARVPARGQVRVGKPRVRQGGPAIAVLDQCGSGALPFIGAGGRPVARAPGSGNAPAPGVGAQYPLIEYFENGFLVGSRESGRRGPFEAVHIECLQPRLHVAALARQGILHQGEGPLRCQRIGTPAVAVHADAGHGLLAPAVQIQ